MVSLVGEGTLRFQSYICRRLRCSLARAMLAHRHHPLIPSSEEEGRIESPLTGTFPPPIRYWTMAKAKHWIEPHPQGIYVRPADIWIDPSVPKENAVVTHGHADHARGGHGDVWATPETLAIMGLRYGTEAGTAIGYGEGFERGGVRFSLHSAGHVLGSAQVLMEYDGERVVVTGDFHYGDRCNNP